MENFWFWFIRPFAELLGQLALIVGVIVVVFIIMLGAGLLNNAYHYFNDNRKG